MLQTNDLSEPLWFMRLNLSTQIHLAYYESVNHIHHIYVTRMSDFSVISSVRRPIKSDQTLTQGSE